MDLFRRQAPRTEIRSPLHRTLTAFDLLLLGIGVIIGAGVFVMTGIAAATKAGPAIVLSYAIAGLVALFAALAYAELAASIGGCGSAYGYTFAGFGEIIAWIVGWNLLFEYMIATSTIAIGWSGYVNDALASLHLHLPGALTHTPFEGGILNLPAMSVIAILAVLLCAGTRQSARFNFAMVCIKLFTIGLFIAVAAFHAHLQNWHPYFPFGWQGVMNGAAVVFYAYIGFDALSTTAEETQRPQRDLPTGIVFSLLICTIIYILVSGLLTAIVPWHTLNVDSPVSEALLKTGHPIGAGFIAAGAVAGLTTGMLMMYSGVTRITFAISRDGLLPPIFSVIHPRTRTPIPNILILGTVILLIAGFVPLNDAAELVNIGTLSVFTIVSLGVLVLRKLHPELPRPFKLPFGPLIPALGVISCVFLMCHLPLITWIRFIVWMAIGLLIYFTYGYRHSILAHRSVHKERT